MTCGVAARPASWRATVVTGRAKNRKKAAVATSHMTMMPVKTRRTRNRVIAMSVHSRRTGGRGVREIGVLEGHLARTLALARPASGEDALGPWVHRVPDAVTQQVERQRGDEQRDGGEHHVPPGLLVEARGVGENVAPARRRLLDPETEEGERGLEHHGGRDVKGGQH